VIFCRIGQGVCVWVILDYFEATKSVMCGISAGVILVLLVFLNAITTQLIYLQASELGMQIRVALTDLIYSKVSGAHGLSRVRELRTKSELILVPQTLPWRVQCWAYHKFTLKRWEPV